MPNYKQVFSNINNSASLGTARKNVVSAGHFSSGSSAIPSQTYKVGQLIDATILGIVRVYECVIPGTVRAGAVFLAAETGFSPANTSPDGMVLTGATGIGIDTNGLLTSGGVGPFVAGDKGLFIKLLGKTYKITQYNSASSVNVTPKPPVAITGASNLYVGPHAMFMNRGQQVTTPDGKVFDVKKDVSGNVTLTQDADGAISSTTNIVFSGVVSKYTVSSPVSYIDLPIYSDAIAASGKPPRKLLLVCDDVASDDYGGNFSHIKMLYGCGNTFTQSGVASPGVKVYNKLRVKQYSGAWSSLPNFDELKSDRTAFISTSGGISMSPNWIRGALTKTTNVGAVFTGFIKMPTAAGTYTFRIQSDDGCRVMISNANGTGTQYFGRQGLQSAGLSTSDTCFITISSGEELPLKMEYFQRSGDMKVQLDYAFGSVIPTSGSFVVVGANASTSFGYQTLPDDIISENLDDGVVIYGAVYGYDGSSTDETYYYSRVTSLNTNGGKRIVATTGSPRGISTSGVKITEASLTGFLDDNSAYALSTVSSLPVNKIRLVLRPPANLKSNAADWARFTRGTFTVYELTDTRTLR
jgi:PA14 domain